MAGDSTNKLNRKWDEKKFFCVGLDPVIEKLPDSVRDESALEASLFTFNREIIDRTADLVLAYKPNSAFYEAYGEAGLRALKQTSLYVREHYPEVPMILDAKRADIGNTNEMYAEAVFDEMEFDAVTIHPYLGREAVMPFLDRKDKLIFVLVKTSNPGSGEFQDLPVNGRKLYEEVASRIASDWNRHGNCGVVVGAPYPEELKHVRQIVGDMPILIPGIGAQGGDARASYEAGKNTRGAGVLLSAGRSIIYASSGTDFAEAARNALQNLARDIENVWRGVYS